MESELRKKITELLLGRQDLFLVDLQGVGSEKVRVLIDGDQGFSVEDASGINRELRAWLDTQNHDFQLEVSSPGIDFPLKEVRQYRKNIGRTLEVENNEGQKNEGELKEVSDEGITLEFKTREPKPVGKGKHTVIKNVDIPYHLITKAKVKIKF